MPQYRITHLTSEELAQVIRQERRRKELSMEQVGGMVGKSRQWIHEAEHSTRKSPRLDELRMEIFRKFFPGEVLTGPMFLRSTPTEASIFDQAEQNRAA